MSTPTANPTPHPHNETPDRKPAVTPRSLWLVLACSAFISLAEYTGFRSELTVGKGGFMAAVALALTALSWRIWPRRPRVGGAGLPGESEQLRDTRWTRDGVLVFFYVGAWGILLCAFQSLTHKEGSARIAFSVVGAATVTASAAAVVGTLLGFLFAIPRSSAKESREANASEPAVADGAAPPTPRRTRGVLGVNTNLEEISDWLTKIIVGLGLINLEKIPGHLAALGRYFGKGLGDIPGGDSIALALLLLFGVSGFLMGYLLTRLYLAGALDRALSPGEALQNAVARIGASSAPPTEVIREVEVAAARASAEQAQRMVRKLAQDYETMRRDMPFTAERTALLDGVVLGMKGLANSATSMTDQLLGSTSAGERLAAIAFLYMKPDPKHIEWLGERFKSETPFIKYHAARALARMADVNLTDEQKAKLREALNKALAGIPASDGPSLAPIHATLERLKP